MSYPLTKGYGLNTSALETLNGGQFILLTLKQQWWTRQNLSLQYLYNNNQISDENKEKDQFGDN